MLLTCDWCKKQSIYLRTARRTSRAAGGAQRVWVYETVDLEQVWPKPAPRQLAPEAPSAVREVFSEAALAEAGGAMRLAGVGYRSVVEQIVKERGAPGKNLKAMIAALSDMGYHKASSTPSTRQERLATMLCMTGSRILQKRSPTLPNSSKRPFSFSTSSPLSAPRWPQRVHLVVQQPSSPRRRREAV